MMMMMMILLLLLREPNCRGIFCVSFQHRFLGSKTMAGLLVVFSRGLLPGRLASVSTSPNPVFCVRAESLRSVRE